MMSIRRTLLLLLLPLCGHAIEDLYVQNLTCSSSYPIQLNSITAECANYCTLGTTANFGTWLSYSGVNMASAKIKVNVNFIPSVNLTKAYENNLGYVNFGIMSHDTHFSEVVSVCQDGYSCTNKGQFYFGFQYQLPSFGSSLNNIIDDYQLQFDIVSYDYDSYAASSSGSSKMKVLGNCKVFLTSDNSTIRSTVYAKSNSSGYFLFAAALVSAFAAITTLQKSNKTPKKIFDCHDEDTDINAFHQMPSEFEKVGSINKRQHSIPEKIFELKNYVSESATMFWEETHSWPRAGSTFTNQFAEATDKRDESDENDSSPFSALEEGVLSGSIVSVSENIEQTSSLSHQLFPREDDDNNNVVPSFSCAVEAKEINAQDENKFFVDDMKIIPSVDKQDAKKLGLTETESSDEESEDEEENEKEENVTKKDLPNVIKKTGKQPVSSVKKSNYSKSSGSRFSIRKMFGGSSHKGFAKV